VVADRKGQRVAEKEEGPKFMQRLVAKQKARVDTRPSSGITNPPRIDPLKIPA
jgi:hypothetical protein